MLTLIAEAESAERQHRKKLQNLIRQTEGTVRIAGYRHGDNVAIEVSDTGIGMAAHEIPKALEHFGQVDSSLSRKYEGVGLGLPLAKRLTELHGGQLDVESAPGAGTKVTVLLRAEPVWLELEPA